MFSDICETENEKNPSLDIFLSWFPSITDVKKVIVCGSTKIFSFSLVVVLCSKDNNKQKPFQGAEILNSRAGP